MDIVFKETSFGMQFLQQLMIVIIGRRAHPKIL